MARKARKKEEDVDSARHEAETHLNAMPVDLASYDTSKQRPKKYDYDPHLDLQLLWSGKKEHTTCEVPPVSLHIHERIAPEAIICLIKREDHRQTFLQSLRYF